MSGHHHGGHGHGHHGLRGGAGFYPAWVYELECDPNDPFYRQCIARFGNDFNSRPAGSMSPVGYDVLFGYGDDVKAIRAYFDQTEARTPEAQQIKDAFIKWYDGLWITANYTDQATYDLARNQRNRFNLANATTPEDKAQVADVIKTGLSSEEAQGDPDRRLSDGMLPGPQTPPKPPLIPPSWLLGGGIVGGLALIAAAYGRGRR